MPDIEADFQARYLAAAADVSAFPGVRERLACVGASHRMFILSTVARASIEAALSAWNVRDAVVEVVVGAAHKVAPLAALIERHSLTRVDTLMCGDSEHDIEAGKACGVQTGGVTYGYTTAERIRAARPDRVFADFAAIVEHVASQARADAEDRPIATVGGLIFRDDGRLLLVRTEKWSHLYAVPGGKIDRGETMIQAFRREVREETGLAIADIAFVCVQDCIDHPEFYKRRHYLLINFVARTAGDTPVLNHEATDYTWATLDHSLTLPLNQPTRVLIEQVRDRGLAPRSPT